MIARPGFGPYDVRPHVRDDVDAVTDLIAAVERSVLGVVHVQRADIASLWSTDTFTPELDGVAVLEAGRMVAAAQLYVPGFRTQKDAKIRTEWRAFATQSATSMSLEQQGKKFSDRFELDIAPFASKETFTAPTSRMVDVTKSYMGVYEINKDPSTEDTVNFMKEHEDWVQEAVDLYHELSVEKDAPKE